MLRSVRSRVIALAVGVATVAILMTAWLTTLSAEQATRDQATASLQVDATIYDRLSQYGGENRTWDYAAPLVQKLSTTYGRRIALTDLRGRLLVDSDRAAGGDSRPLPATPTARIDPTDPAINPFGVPSLGTSTPSDQVSPAVIAGAVACLEAAHIPYTMVEIGGQQLPQRVPGSGADADAFNRCTDAVFADVSVSPQQAANYDAAVSECLTAAGFTPIVVADDVTTVEQTPAAETAVTKCIDQAATTAFAPAALLYLGTAVAIGPFTGSSLWRSLMIAGAILLVAALLAWWLGRRITKPLGELTHAATQLAAGRLDHRASTAGTNEVSVLARAFNSLGDSLQRNETIRRQMVSDIAHELRNPLATIGGTLEAIEDQVYEPTPAVLGSLNEEVTRLRSLVRDLQQLANADADAMSVRLDPGDLGALAAAAVDAHQPSANSARVALTMVDARPTESLVLMDAPRLRQVFDNLLVNAVRHTPSGGAITVTVTADGFSVADTGEGIATEDLGCVFDRFWRADSSRASSTGGSGLGLAIAKELVDSHGGEISVASELGDGATFTVRGLQPAH